MERSSGRDWSAGHSVFGIMCVFIITDKAKLVGEEVKGVGVMKD